MFADYHVHTSYSDDSEYPMEEVVRDAVSLGLEEICFTDHVDYGIKREWDDPRGIRYRRGSSGEPEHMAKANVDYPRYAAEIAAYPRGLFLYNDDCHYKEQSGDNQADQFSAKL